MARIPTNKPKLDQEGYVSNGKNITLNETVTAVNKNEPIFGVGNSKLQGYIALDLYQQHQSSVVSGNKAPHTPYVLFNGTSYSSGKPFVMNDYVWATDVNGGA